MNYAIWNPITGEWERINDLDRPFPVIARDTRLVIANNEIPFTPSLGSSGSTGHTDPFGVANSNIANIGIYSAQAEPNVVIPDVWRIRRFVVMFFRTQSGGTNVELSVQVYGRLIRADGTSTVWRTVGSASESGSGNSLVRAVIATSLSGVFGFDQYRFTFRRNPDSTPAPELSEIRIYAEY